MLKVLKVLVLAMVLTPLGVRAEDGLGPWVGDGPAQSRLILATTAHDGAPLAFGIEIALKPGWKTYWRNPGEGGIPPEFNWEGSSNISTPKVAFPAPHRISMGGVDAIVYDQSVVFPVTAAIGDAAKPVAIRLTLRYGVCEKICVPREDRLQIDLPAGAPALTGAAAILADWRAKLPVPFATAGWTIKRIDLRDGPAPRLAVTLGGAKPLTPDSDLLVEGPDSVWSEKPRLAMPGEGGGGMFSIPLGPANAAQLLKGQTLTLTLVGNGQAAETTVVVQ